MTEAVDVLIPDIEKELSALSQVSKNKSQTKACLFTLVIYSHEPKRIKYFQEIVDSILDKFPCRIIFIQEEQSNERYLHVNVAAVASKHQETTVVCDQITITTSASELPRVPYLVTPHIVPDLPLYLLWSQTPFSEKIVLPALQPYASRVIFDSDCSTSLPQFSQEVLQSLSLLKMDVMDINWALISNWRDVLVQLFDTPEKYAVLQHCRVLKIKYQSAETKNCHHPEIRAIYLQGWLAARLKWKYQSTEKLDGLTMITYQNPSHPSIVSLCPQSHGDLASGAVISIEIESADGYSFYVSRNHALSQVVVHASSADKCELPYTLPLPNVHQGFNFVKEIFYNKLGNHYRELLQIITKMGPFVSN